MAVFDRKVPMFWPVMLFNMDRGASAVRVKKYLHFLRSRNLVYNTCITPLLELACSQRFACICLLRCLIRANLTEAAALGEALKLLACSIWFFRSGTIIIALLV